MLLRVIWGLILSALAAGPAFAVTLLSEGFDDVSQLSGAGWVLTNRSSPAGATGWFQGNAGIFLAHGGADEACVAANFENAGFGGNVSDWLITPTLILSNGDEISFYSRTAGAPAYRTGGPVPDRLEVRLSSNGISSNVGASDSSVGDFSTLLLTVNSGLVASGYPAVWSSFTATVSGLARPTAGRIALRYFVPDTSTRGDYIGVDTLIISSVPEPGASVLVAFGSLALTALHS